MLLLVSTEGVQNSKLNTFFFSTESLTRVEPLPEDVFATCPRCKQAIPPGSMAVRCPSCGVWHDQRDEKPCWTYAERCAACQNQPTALDADFRWTPEDL